VTIAGNATFEWEGEVTVDLAAETAHDLAVTRRREDEVAAWQALITR
jgi:diaminopimelate epimerase